MIHATSTGRRCIATALQASGATPSELRTFLYASVELVSWSRTCDQMPLPQVSAATRLHPHTVGRNMRAWHDRGVWHYSPARREGEYGTVRLNDIDTELGFTPTDTRDLMAVVWPTMRRAALRTCRGPVAAVRVVLAVLGGAACWSRLEVAVSHKELADAAGCTIAQVRRALSWLVANDVIEYTPGTGHSPSVIRLVAADAMNAGPGHQAELELHSPATSALPAPAPGLATGPTGLAPLNPPAASPCPQEEHPGCASDDRPVHDRENADLVILPLSRDASASAPGDLHSINQNTPGADGASDPRAGQVAAQLSARTDREVALEGPGGFRLEAEITLRPTWRVEELVEALLAVKLPASVMHPAALFAYRATQLPKLSPADLAALRAAAHAERRRARDVEQRQAAEAEAAADAAANAALEPHLARIAQLSPADLADLAGHLPGWLRPKFNPANLTPLVRHGIAEALAARDGIDLQQVAETARQESLTHRTGTMVAV